MMEGLVMIVVLFDPGISVDDVLVLGAGGNFVVCGKG